MSVAALAGASGSLSPGTSEPVVNQALEPASVRHGSAAVQKAYQSALAFEQVLVEQLSKSLSAGLGEESESESSAGGSANSAESSELSSTLPQALSSGVMNAGGLGLAAQMAQQMQAHEGATAALGGAATVSASNGGSGSTAATEPTATIAPSSGGTGA